MTGRLYVCSTPIGNLADVTLRLLSVLEKADVIAAEDTRRTRKLLTYHKLKARLVSYHEHNERTQAVYLAEQVRAGLKVALVTDAGTPSISDPGYRLVRECIDAQLPVEVIPGPSAITAAIAVSGISAARFVFEGFLPKKAGERTKRLELLAEEPRTTVFFETAKRLVATLEDLRQILGERSIAVCREMTKIHEQVLRGTVSEVLSQLGPEPAGEVVVVMSGADVKGRGLDAAVEMAQELAGSGMSKSRAAAEAAHKCGVARRDVYQGLLKKNTG